MQEGLLLKFSTKYLASSLVLFAVPTFAQKSGGFVSHLGGNVGGSYLLGNMTSSRVDLPSRTMNAFTTQALLGYRFEKLLVGLDLDYRWLGQRTKLSSEINTNLRGRGPMFGLGANYAINDQWAVQGALGILGGYNFIQDTHTGEDDELDAPLGLKAKLQYFPWGNLPLSTDLDLQYIRYRKLVISGTSYADPVGSFLVGVGLTWHFGAAHATKAVAQLEEVPALPPENQQAELEKVARVERTAEGIMLVLDGDVSFASASDELSPEAAEIIRKAAAVLVKQSGQKIRIEGHTDTSGRKAGNQVLSQRRATSVKNAFVAEGLKVENLTASGFGSERPVAENATKPGRAKNRRVEIYIDDQAATKEGVQQ